MGKSSLNDTKKKGRCVSIFKGLDVGKLKPFLIYKYDKEELKRVKDYHDTLMAKGRLIEEAARLQQFEQSDRKSMLEIMTTRNRPGNPYAGNPYGGNLSSISGWKAAENAVEEPFKFDELDRVSENEPRR